jgi:hypothetical protein
LEAPQSCNINRKTARRIKCVAHLGALGPGVRSASIIPCSNAVELSNNIIQKGLALGRDLSGTVVNFGRVSALRDPAPPARWPKWGFGGAALRRHQPNGDLNVKVCEEAVISVNTDGSECRKAVAAHNTQS